MSLLQVGEMLRTSICPMHCGEIAVKLQVAESDVQCWIEHWLRTGLVAEVTASDLEAEGGCSAEACRNCALSCFTYYRWVQPS